VCCVGSGFCLRADHWYRGVLPGVCVCLCACVRACVRACVWCVRVVLACGACVWLRACGCVRVVCGVRAYVDACVVCVRAVCV
jgi:hypothetical protein